MVEDYQIPAVGFGEGPEHGTSLQADTVEVHLEDTVEVLLEGTVEVHLEDTVEVLLEGTVEVHLEDTVEDTVEVHPEDTVEHIAVVEHRSQEVQL